MGNNIPCGDSNVDETLKNILEYVQDDIAIRVSKLSEEIPKTYREEHERIVEQMKKASPRPYENLLYSEYPGTNVHQVDKLAIQHTTSTTVKQEITNEIFQEIEPKINEKLADQNSLVRSTIKKGVKKTIEQTVDKTIDEIVKKLNLSKKPSN